MTKLMKQSGFTLIEILVSITVVSIVSALAAPSLASLMNHNKTKAASVLFQDNLRQARYDSKTHSSSTVVFCAVKKNINRKEECVENNNQVRFSNGWQWFVDENNNYQYDPTGDTLLGNTFEVDTTNIDVEVELLNGNSDRILRNRVVFNNGDSKIISKSGDAATNTGEQITPVILFTDDAGRFSKVSFDITGRSTLKHH